MSTHDATLTMIRDEHGERGVVTRADEVIWLADELMAEARKPGRERIPGDLEYHVVQDPDDYGDLISFGTPGEGLGRLTYRLVGRDQINGWYIAKRQP